MEQYVDSTLMLIQRELVNVKCTDHRGYCRRIEANSSVIIDPSSRGSIVRSEELDFVGVSDGDFWQPNFHMGDVDVTDAAVFQGVPSEASVCPFGLIVEEKRHFLFSLNLESQDQQKGYSFRSGTMKF